MTTDDELIKIIFQRRILANLLKPRLSMATDFANAAIMGIDTDSVNTGDFVTLATNRSSTVTFPT